PVHLARPLGGAPRRRRGDRDVSRAPDRARLEGGGVRDAAAPVHPRPPGEQPVNRSAPSLQAHRGQGRAALAARAAARLRLPPALSVRQRALPYRSARAAVLSGHHPPARLPRRGGARPPCPPGDPPRGGGTGELTRRAQLPWLYAADAPARIARQVERTTGSCLPRGRSSGASSPGEPFTAYSRRSV